MVIIEERTGYTYYETEGANDPDIDSNNHYDINVGDGETLENVMIDNTAPDAMIRIFCNGGGWTVRNIGFRGEMDYFTGTNSYGTISGRHPLYVADVPAGEVGVFDQIYMGDGCQSRGVAGAAFVNRNIQGTIYYRRMNVQEWIDNGLYCSAHGKEGGGTIVVEDCYLANNTTDNCRLAAGDIFRDSVSLSIKSGGEKGNGRGGWTDLNRGMWGREGGLSPPVEISNVDFEHPWEGSGGTIYAGEPGVSVEVYDSRFGEWPDAQLRPKSGEITLVSGNGGSPDTSVPEGVPLTATAAATGDVGSGGGGGGGSDSERSLIELQYDTEAVQYLS